MPGAGEQRVAMSGKGVPKQEDSPRVLVTGGSGVLGRAIVEVLRREGARVAFAYHRDEEGAGRIAAATGAHPFRLDLLDQKGPDRLVEEVEGVIGPLDGLVNNAGVRGDALLALTSDADWERVVGTNLGGVFRCCRAVIPGMVHRRRGALVNVISLAALHGVTGQAAYAASKAGVLGLTRSLAREVGRRNIRVNAVAPGFMPTAMTEALTAEAVSALRRAECLPEGVQPASVAETVAFLLSPRAASITGQCIVVDAGVST